MSSRIFLIRHGETDWSLNQRHTGSTDIPLTANGERQVKVTAETFVGNNKLIQPKNISHIYCSPRVRARRTLELLNLDSASHPPVTITQLLQEWDYGNYEGLTVEEVRKLRKSRNLDHSQHWNIWKDGCEDGETSEQVSTRLEEFIQGNLKPQLLTRGETSSERNQDIVCVAHGHILSALAMRWAQQPLDNAMRLLVETAGIGILCFEHGSVEEPAVLLGARPE